MTHGEFTLKFSKMLTEYEKEIRVDEREKTIDEAIDRVESIHSGDALKFLIINELDGMRFEE